ncbi:MAG TPA: hypothetical protein VEU62_16805 [Bryobacterales bacterium]|nr:hypothetical protein [Bryobacterales bacterium]
MGDRLDRFHRSLHAILRSLPLTLDPPQLALLDRHFELLERWNRKLNLTSVRDPEQIARRHFGESSSPPPFSRLRPRRSRTSVQEPASPALPSPSPGRSSRFL